jgi:hypothetical protein
VVEVPGSGTKPDIPAIYMKLPSKLLICGVVYKLKQSCKHNGGSYDEATKTIEIGTELPEDVPEILLHEVIEACAATRDLRYALEKEELTNDHYKFVLSHKEFEQLMKDVAASLKGISFK